MLKVLGWLAIGVGGLLVLGVLTLLLTGREGSSDFRSDLRSAALDLAGGGMGFHDGALVWREKEPYRITIEELPTLENRRLGSRYSGGLLSDDMAWFGISLREILARCLSLRADRVRGDESLDQRWFDVDAARPHETLSSGVSGWEPVHERILGALLEHYELTLESVQEQRELTVLRAGPGWAEHAFGKPDGTWASTTTSGDGLIHFQPGTVRRLVVLLEESLGPLEEEGLEGAAFCNVELHWTPGDTDSLKKVLVEQLDLHVTSEERTVEVAVVTGFATSLHDPQMRDAGGDEAHDEAAVEGSDQG